MVKASVCFIALWAVHTGNMMYNSTNDQVICDPITPLENFNVSKYVGTWNEQKHVRMIVEPSDCSCSTAEYTDLSNSVDANSFGNFNLFQNPICIY